MQYTNITPQHLQFLATIVGKEFVFTDDATLQQFAHDETEDFQFPPQVVVKPKSAQEISEILCMANREKIPVVPIGAQTGLSGGALCVQGGIALATERLNAILQIDENNLQVITEPAVITEVLQNAVAEKGLFYPVDPSSKGSCFIGGNVAENAGGARAVKYGVTKDYVLNLEVVLPTGEIIWTGANTLKNATGYNLTQLMVGSEGTLGIITKIVLKLIPQITQQVLMLVPFYKATQACEAVATIFKAGIAPSALEFMERSAIDWSLQFQETAIEIDVQSEAYLLIELDGNDTSILMQEAEKLFEIVAQFEIGEPLFADTHEQKNIFWKMRRGIAEAVKSHSVYKEEDTVVPRFALPQLLKVVKELGKSFGFQSICYGHAGDGNLHINIIRGQLTEQQWEEDLPKAITQLFEATVALGGTLSGEHGIGFVQKQYMPIAFDATTLQLMKAIKKVFDPNAILNPQKIWE